LTGLTRRGGRGGGLRRAQPGRGGEPARIPWSDSKAPAGTPAAPGIRVADAPPAGPGSPSRLPADSVTADYVPADSVAADPVSTAPAAPAPTPAALTPEAPAAAPDPA